MSKHRKGEIYARRSNGKEHTSSWRTAIRLEYYKEKNGVGEYFVLLRHGRKNEVLEVGDTKRELLGRVVRRRFR